MADQATVKPSPAPRYESNGVIGGVSALGGNVVNLAILQTRLTVLDLLDVTRKSTPAVVTLVIVLLALPSGLVLGSLGLALWLSTLEALNLYQACLIVAGVVLLLAVIASVVAGLAIRKSFGTFRRSSEELQRNLAWVRTVITQSGR